MDAVPTTPQVFFPTRKATWNYARICRLITGICTEICRILFSKHIPPNDLKDILKKNRPELRRQLNSVENALIYPAINEDVNPSLTVKDFDFSLMFKLLKKLKFITPHQNGWFNDPQEDDKSIAACMDIIMKYRNTGYAHIADDAVNTADFKRMWDKLKFAVVEMEKTLIGGSLFQDAVDYLAGWNIDEEKQHETKGENILHKRNDIKCQWFKKKSRFDYYLD